jgi:hypothetical protein
VRVLLTTDFELIVLAVILTATEAFAVTAIEVLFKTSGPCVTARVLVVTVLATTSTALNVFVLKVSVDIELDTIPTDTELLAITLADVALIVKGPAATLIILVVIPFDTETLLTVMVFAVNASDIRVLAFTVTECVESAYKFAALELAAKGPTVKESV